MKKWQYIIKLVAKLTFCWAEMTETSVALHLMLITFCHEQRMHSTHPFLTSKKKKAFNNAIKSSFKIPITSHLMCPNSSWSTQRPFRIMCAKCYFLASVSCNATSFAENIVQENVHLVLKSTYLQGLGKIKVSK